LRPFCHCPAARARLLAASPHGSPPWAIGALGWLLLIHTASGTSPGFYRGGFLLAAVCVGALLTAAVRYPAGPLARALSWEPFRLLGVISYGVYLVHWPLFLALSSSSTGTTGATLLAIRLAATGVVALMSYRFIERPFRAGTALPRWRAPFALATGLAVLAGFAVVAVRPLPTRGPVLVSGPLPSVAPPPALRAPPRRALVRQRFPYGQLMPVPPRCWSWVTR